MEKNIRQILESYKSGLEGKRVLVFTDDDLGSMIEDHLFSHFNDYKLDTLRCIGKQATNSCIRWYTGQPERYSYLTSEDIRTEGIELSDTFIGNLDDKREIERTQSDYNYLVLGSTKAPISDTINLDMLLEQQSNDWAWYTNFNG